MELSDRRALENELRFKQANEEIDARRRELDVDGRTPYICECEDERCTHLVRLSLDEYREVRLAERQFLIGLGHPTRGRSVAERNGYTIVVKRNE